MSGALLLVFLACHGAASALALGGRASYEAVTTPLQGSAARALAEAAVVALLVAHAAGGLVRARARTAGASGPRRARALTGLLTAVFVAIHLARDWAPRVNGGFAAADQYDRLARDLSTTGALGVAWHAGLYLTGAALACAHAHLGLRGPGPLASAVERRAGGAAHAALAAGLPLAIFILFAAAVLHLATGGLPGGGTR